MFCCPNTPGSSAWVIFKASAELDEGAGDWKTLVWVSWISKAPEDETVVQSTSLNPFFRIVLNHHRLIFGRQDNRKTTRNVIFPNGIQTTFERCLIQIKFLQMCLSLNVQSSLIAHTGFQSVSSVKPRELDVCPSGWAESMRLLAEQCGRHYRDQQSTQTLKSAVQNDSVIGPGARWWIVLPCWRTASLVHKGVTFIPCRHVAEVWRRKSDQIACK